DDQRDGRPEDYPAAARLAGRLRRKRQCHEALPLSWWANYPTSISGGGIAWEAGECRKPASLTRAPNIVLTPFPNPEHNPAARSQSPGPHFRGGSHASKPFASATLDCHSAFPELCRPCGVVLRRQHTNAAPQLLRLCRMDEHDLVLSAGICTELARQLAGRHRQLEQRRRLERRRA